MKLILKIFKWLTGITSGALSILFLLYIGLQKNGIIIDSDGNVIVNRTMAICLIAAWAVIGALFLLIEYLYKRSIKPKTIIPEQDETDNSD